VNFAMAPSKTVSTHPFEYEAGYEALLCSGWKPDQPGFDKTEMPQLCKAGKSSCSVSPDGCVYPCIMMPLKLGSLKESSFESLWHIEPCAELRYLRSMRRSDLYACYDCELRAFCQRCAGVAYIESGELNGPGTSACRQALMRWQLIQAEEVRSCEKKSTSSQR
jgi:radical SAM protein with 4Fe4S-binding SPASM domain